MTIVDKELEDSASQDTGVFAAPNEWTESSMERHDLFTLEAKLDYTLQKTKPKNQFDLNIFFFIPSSLHVNKSSYGKDRFYADMTNYMRFKTPQIALAGLIHDTNPLSPLNAINKLMIALKSGDNTPKIIEKAQYELRILGSIVKSTLREQMEYFQKEISACISCNEILPQIEDYLKLIITFRQRMATMTKDFATVQIDTRLRESFKFADEYISLQIERRLTWLLKQINTDPDLASLKTLVITIIEKEQEHRRNIKSRLIAKENTSNEAYIYWEGIYKKYIQGILYLDVKPNDEKSKFLSLFYALAAGFAMFISLLAGLWISQFFANGSMALVFGLVVAYMLKDRIKEAIRGMSFTAVSVLFPDRKYDIFDNPSKKQIGAIKENMRFIHWRDVPPEVLNLREASNKYSIEHEGKPEVVMKYKKTTIILPSQVDQYHERHSDIHDIFRFNVQHFVQYADDPVQNESVWDAIQQKLKEFPCEKVYHLNLIFKMQAYDIEGEDKVYYKKVRVVLDQHGIKRVEESETKI